MASAGDDNEPPERGRGTQRITIPLPRPLQPGQRYTLRMVPAVQVPGADGVRVVRPAQFRVINQPQQGNVPTQQQGNVPTEQQGNVPTQQHGNVPTQQGANPRPHHHHIRLVRPPQGHGLRLVNAGTPNAHFHIVHPTGQQSQQAQHLLRQQQELQQQIERTRQEEQRQKEELQSKLKISEAPEVEHKLADESSLSWKPVTDTKPTYLVQMLTDTNKSPQEIYKGSESCCTVDGKVLAPGHTYTFTVAASVGEVTGEPSPSCVLQVPARVPAKPLPPKIGTRNKSSVTLRWNAPADNGAAITCYELEWDQCRGEWEQLCSDKAKQYKFSHKFSPSTMAEFRIRASNDIGWSEFSEVLLFSAGAGPPSVPSKPHLLQAGADHLNVGWSTPSSNGAEITNYKLEKEDSYGGHGFIPEYNGPDLSYNCTGLLPNTSYKFRVYAQNDKGWSQPSQPSSIATVAAQCGAPGPPGLRDKATPTSLCVSWSSPTNTGGVPVQVYVLEMSDGETESEFTEVYRGLEDNHLIKDLLPGRKYLCRACALTEAGHGKWSSVAHLRTPATKPDCPVSFCLAAQPTKTAVALQWGSPLSNGGASITSYSLESRQSSKSEDSWKVLATVADSGSFEDKTVSSHCHTVAQLAPGEEYVFRVSARNSVGLSPPSVECECTTAPGEPDPPSNLQVASLTAKSVQVHWMASVTHGCLVESYEVQCSPCGASEGKSTTLSTVNTRCTVGNLQPATPYQVRVKALSSAGPSEWSVLVTFTTSPSVPLPPTHITMLSCTPYSMLVSWGAPCSNGSPVTAYHLEYSCDKPVSVEVSPLETQYNIVGLRPSTSYRYRVLAENGIGRGQYGPYCTSHTLPPPPSPPLLTLSSTSHQALKLSWAKKVNKTLTYILQIASQGKQFHEVYRGSGIHHRVTRLQPDTDYTLRIAAVSESGQGVWSDDVTLSTTPSPPSPPTGLVLRQESNEHVQLKWEPGVGGVRYEVQMKSPTGSRDFTQVYKGSDCECSLPISTFDKPHEVRVRSWTTCTVNSKEEQLWSNFSQTSVSTAAVKAPGSESIAEEKPQEIGEDVQVKTSVDVKSVSPQTMATVVFVLVAVLTVIMAFLLGQYAI